MRSTDLLLGRCVLWSWHVEGLPRTEVDYSMPAVSRTRTLVRRPSKAPPLPGWPGRTVMVVIESTGWADRTTETLVLALERAIRAATGDRAGGDRTAAETSSRCSRRAPAGHVDPPHPLVSSQALSGITLVGRDPSPPADLLLLGCVPAGEFTVARKLRPCPVADGRDSVASFPEQGGDLVKAEILEVVKRCDHALAPLQGGDSLGGDVLVFCVKPSSQFVRIVAVGVRWNWPHEASVQDPADTFLHGLHAASLPGVTGASEGHA
jgi:hypothetical protein